MTQTLKDLMCEKADERRPPVFDAVAIAADGDRRVRRRRLSTTSIAVAVVALGAVTAPGLLGGDGASHTEGLVANDGGTPGAFAERHVSYAAGREIHDGTEVVDVGRRILSFAQTDDGFVYAARGGDVWLYDGEGSSQVGHSDNNRLRADDTGSLVAWVDHAADGAPQYVVYDTGARTEVARVDDDAAGTSRDPGDEGAEVFAVDDGAAYWRTTDGLVRYDVASGDMEMLAQDQPVSDPAHKHDRVTDIVDVSGGLLAYLVEGKRGSRMMVGPAIGPDAEQMPSGWNGVLSPDGRYLGVEEADELAVYDTANGEEVTPALDRYPFKVIYGWVDEDTAMVFAIKSLDGGGYPSDFLACHLPQGDCEVVSEAEVGNGSFTLPVGDPMDS